MTDVAYDVSGPIATITIDRPDKRNAINGDVVREISSFLTEADGDEAVKVVVLTGAGDKAFCAGGDLGGMSSEGAVQQHFIRSEVGQLFAQMRASRLPIVAKVNGHALAGGFGLMLACDLVVACDEAELGMPEVSLGLWPFMITAVVARDLPRKVALDLMLTGKRIPASEGERFGFVNRVVARSELDAATTELATEVAGKSSLILKLGKNSFYNAEDQTFDAALDYLAGMLSVALQSEDTIEGISAFFQKRPPEWKNR